VYHTSTDNQNGSNFQHKEGSFDYVKGHSEFTHWRIRKTILAELKNNYPYYKVPVAFIPVAEKDPDEGDKKGVSMKLTLNINGAFIDNPTTQVQPVYNQGTVEQYFKLVKSLSLILRGQTFTEKFRLALQTLRGTDAALWQREWDEVSPQIAEAAGIDPELQELLL
jgi:hypothetical protein